MKIENWNELTEQQKKNAENQLKIIEKEKTNNDTANFFKNNSYVVVKNVIDKNLANFLY